MNRNDSGYAYTTRYIGGLGRIKTGKKWLCSNKTTKTSVIPFHSLLLFFPELNHISKKKPPYRDPYSVSDIILSLSKRWPFANSAWKADSDLPIQPTPQTYPSNSATNSSPLLTNPTSPKMVHWEIMRNGVSGSTS